MGTKVDIISGFLGSGKTTLINKLISEKPNTEKVALIENEFGEVGIDATILGRSNLEVKEINSGCICCTLVGDFEKAIGEIVMKFKPDRIIIEPSGVGKLSDVVRACKSGRLEGMVSVNMVVTVVDVLRFELYISNFSEFYKNQIENAKTVILSRTQNADKSIVESVVKKVRELNRKANIITTPWDKITGEGIIAVAEQQSDLFLSAELANLQKRASIDHVCHEGCKCEEHGHGAVHHSHVNSHSADEVFDVWGGETPRVFTKKEIDDILKSIRNTSLYGMVLRAKGIVEVEGGKWVQFDYVSGEHKINESSADYTGRLAVIGKNLHKERLAELFKLNTYSPS